MRMTCFSARARRNESARAPAAVEPRTARREIVMTYPPLFLFYHRRAAAPLYRGSACLNPEILVQLLHAGFEHVVGDHIDHLAMLHDVVTIGDGLRETEILLDEQHGKAAILDLLDGPADLLDDDRRDAFGRLIQQQEFGAGPQDARDRQHLLLAAG